MKRVLRISLLPLLTLAAACAKPDKVVVVNSPTAGVFYTVETIHGHGALSSDEVNVFAHAEGKATSKRILVLSGLYLDISSITWSTPNDVVICMPQGITSTFRNEVTLIAGDLSITIHNHLLEHCNSPE